MDHTFEKYLNVIANSEIFLDFSQQEILDFFKCIHPKIQDFEKEEFITIEGEDFDGIGIMLEGSAAAYKINYAGEKNILTLIEPGMAFGEIVVFSKHPRWPVTVEALTRCKAIFIDADKIITQCSRLCTWHTKFIRNFLTILSERAIKLERKIKYLSINRIRGRVCAFLLEEYRKHKTLTFTISFNRQSLADFLNIPRPSLSRELCKMRDEGIISFNRNVFTILDLDSLKRFGT